MSPSLKWKRCLCDRNGYLWTVPKSAGLFYRKVHSTGANPSTGAARLTEQTGVTASSSAASAAASSPTCGGGSGGGFVGHRAREGRQGKGRGPWPGHGTRRGPGAAAGWSRAAFTQQWLWVWHRRRRLLGASAWSGRTSSRSAGRRHDTDLCSVAQPRLASPVPVSL